MIAILAVCLIVGIASMFLTMEWTHRHELERHAARRRHPTQPSHVRQIPRPDWMDD